ncbi:unnamed protein product [Heligmosomoides polygyrus]|uniref:HECT domain-containing protein n=1 Tax=Heligmosomoides polygyrus TaxID=6339 RepID=A0A183F847_HELPZ|nr:unnamed protein product [Heligmosomoides polygyrus]
MPVELSLSADPIQNDSREQFVNCGHQADRAIVANVVHISLPVQQGGPAGLPLRWNLALRQVACEEPRQGVDEHWREVLHVFGSGPVWAECWAFLHRRDSVSDLETEDRGHDASILRKMTCGQISFRNYVLNADMHIERFKIREVASLVDGIDESSLEFLVNALTELILNEDMAKKLKGGIYIF